MVILFEFEVACGRESLGNPGEREWRRDVVYHRGWERLVQCRGPRWEMLHHVDRQRARQSDKADKPSISNPYPVISISSFLFSPPISSFFNSPCPLLSLLVSMIFKLIFMISFLKFPHLFKHIYLEFCCFLFLEFVLYFFLLQLC